MTEHFLSCYHYFACLIFSNIPRLLEKKKSLEKGEEMTVEAETKLYDFLKANGIVFVRHEHPPVYTVEEAAQYWKDIEGTHCKNLFLRNNKGNRHYLVVMEQSKKINLKELADKTGAGRLSFASPERLKRFLGLETGAVSPFGLINDRNKEVIVVLDKSLKRGGKINFHPNINTATVTLSYADFTVFLEKCGNELLYF